MKIFGIQVGKPSLVEMAIDKAIALMDVGEHDAAIAAIKEEALSRAPEDRRALLHLGIAYMVKGEHAEAEEILRPLTEQKHLDSERAAAEIALGKIAAERKQNNV